MNVFNINYYFPSIADSYNITKVSEKFLELEFINYAMPIEKEYLNEKINSYNPFYFYLFFRNPEQENITNNFPHPDIIFPFLSQGFIRIGEHGEKSLLLLDASNYGSHHHLDSLNYFFRTKAMNY